MSCDGQFEDADSPAHRIDRSTPELEASEDSDEECWGLEYEDWRGETGDFTKKLNAVRSGQAGANVQQSRGDSKGSSNITQKAIHVSSI